MEVIAELALDGRGRFLAARFTGYGNMGAYLTPVGPMMTTLNIAKNSIGMYRTPLVEVSTMLRCHQHVPIGAYRGAGRPEGNYFMERLIDVAARRDGIDKVELRRRNHGDQATSCPGRLRLGRPTTAGTSPACSDRAARGGRLEGLCRSAVAKQQARQAAGRGIGCYLEVTAPPRTKWAALHFEPDGTVTIVTGTLDYGQGHWSAVRAGAAPTSSACPLTRSRLMQGDSDRLIAGGGTGGSKSLMASAARLSWRQAPWSSRKAK